LSRSRGQPISTGFKAGTLAGLAMALALSPAGVRGQEFQALVSSCSAASAGLTSRCHVSALALDAARGGLATAASMGSEVAGSASTLGYRLRTFPKVALSARAGLTTFSMPEIREGYTLPVGDEDVLVPALHLTGTAGVFDGFSLRPNVGGVLALDLTAGAHLLFPSEEAGFRENPGGWSLGARLGLLRESFSLPGISISVTRQEYGTAGVGDMSSGDAGEISFDSGLTSFRGVVGKDILGIGLFAGAGQDRMAGGGTIGIRVSPTGFETTATATELPSERAVFFAGGSMTYLIIQFSGEVGWSQAFDAPLPIEPGGTSFPSAKAYFGSLALRMTF
jgi:hypothetical protein